MATRIQTGFNEAFAPMSSPGVNLYDLAMQKARDAGSDMIRVNVGWDAVEPNNINQGRWYFYDANYPYQSYNYYAIATRAQQLGLKVLPVIAGCPPWVPNRQPCHPEWIALNDPNLPIAYFPYGSTGCNEYANFVVRVVQFFQSCSVTVEAVEIWNEPNLYSNVIQMSAANFSALLAASISTVNATYSGAIKVVSGGLYAKANDSSTWQPYLDGFVNQCGGYALGVHPYQMKDWPGDNWVTKADNAVADTIATFDAISNYTLSTYGIYNDMWVTETGAHSRYPLAEEGQARVLRKLLGSGGEFDQRGRCKAGLVHRLFPFDPYGIENPSNQFYQCSVLNPSWTPKIAYNRLAAGWN